MALLGTPLLILSSVLYFFDDQLPLWIRGENVVLVYICLCLIVSIYCPVLLTFGPIIKIFHRDGLTHRNQNSFELEGTGKGDYFYLCLQDERLSKSFETFCVESFAVENLFFYKHAVNYRHLHGEFQKTEAYRMRHEYISSESVFEVSLIPKIKERILKRIEQGEIDDTLFLEAEQEIYLEMRHGIYPLWRRSDMFKEAYRETFLYRSKSFLARTSQFITPVDMKTFEMERVFFISLIFLISKKKKKKKKNVKFIANSFLFLSFLFFLFLSILGSKKIITRR